MTELANKPYFLDPEAEHYSIEMLDRIRRDAKRMQSESVARLVAVAGRALWRAVKWLGAGAYRFYGALVAGVSAKHAYEALNSLSDADLERIGLTRDEIPQRIASIMDEALNAGFAGTSRELHAVEGGRKAKARKPKTELPRRRAA